MVVYDLKDGRKISIRKITGEDAKELVDMSVKVGGQTDNLSFGIDDFYFNEEQQRLFIESIASRDNCLYVAAFLDNKIVGNLNFIASSRKRLMHRGEFGIAVLKEYWGLGIGTSLINYLFKWARFNGTIKKFDLQVREDNIRAINLYMKLGFKIEGKISMAINVDGRYYEIYNMGKSIG